MKNIQSMNDLIGTMNPLRLKTQWRRLLVTLLVLALPLAAAAADQRTFATPEAAVDALVTALKANDDSALIAIFGEKHKNFVTTGDRANDTASRSEAAAQLETFHALVDKGPERRVLLMGANAWPVPIPLVRQGDAWRFATEEGIEELINRRIGGNERNALYVLRAYLDAQRHYAAVDRDGDGVLQYAQKLASTPGKRDGLYWPTGTSGDEEVSPFGPLIAESSAYLAGHKQGDSYRGYHFRILTRQGKGAPGGAYSYIINGRMIAGFAMVAYPDKYGETGVMTFITSHNGLIYEKDLGRNTSSVGMNMTAFDPTGWKEVAD